MLKTAEIGLSLIPQDFKDKATIYLLIDDTLQAKFGKNFDCYTKLIIQVLVISMGIVLYL